VHGAGRVALLLVGPGDAGEAESPVGAQRVPHAGRHGRGGLGADGAVLGEHRLGHACERRLEVGRVHLDAAAEDDAAARHLGDGRAHQPGGERLGHGEGLPPRGEPPDDDGGERVVVAAEHGVTQHAGGHVDVRVEHGRCLLGRRRRRGQAHPDHTAAGQVGQVDAGRQVERGVHPLGHLRLAHARDVQGAGEADLAATGLQAGAHLGGEGRGELVRRTGQGDQQPPSTSTCSPGALPTGLSSTVAPRGTSAWRITWSGTSG
jgi:hypothetical protein